jgi:hypothetical protein
MDVTGVKGPHVPEREKLGHWAANQLLIAQTILDNPGGGLVFATQAIGQVVAALSETEEERWRPVVERLREAEFAAVRRDFRTCRDRMTDALTEIDKA